MNRPQLDEYTLKVGRKTTKLLLRVLGRAMRGGWTLQERRVLNGICVNMQLWLEKPPSVYVHYTVEKAEEDG